MSSLSSAHYDVFRDLRASLPNRALSISGLIDHHLAVGQHVVGWGRTMGLTVCLPLTISHLAAAAIKRDKPAAGCLLAGHEFLEKSALVEQFTFRHNTDFGA